MHMNTDKSKTQILGQCKGEMLTKEIYKTKTKYKATKELKNT